MRPAVHRDGDDIFRRIEAASTQGAGQLIADIALERFDANESTQENIGLQKNSRHRK
jgi:hypothetical protein